MPPVSWRQCSGAKATGQHPRRGRPTFWPAASTFLTRAASFRQDSREKIHSRGALAVSLLWLQSSLPTIGHADGVTEEDRLFDFSEVPQHLRPKVFVGPRAAVGLAASGVPSLFVLLPVVVTFDSGEQREDPARRRIDGGRDRLRHDRAFLSQPLRPRKMHTHQGRRLEGSHCVIDFHFSCLSLSPPMIGVPRSRINAERANSGRPSLSRRFFCDRT